MRFLTMRHAVFVHLLLTVAMAAIPARASETSEALFRGFVAWVDSSPDWSASVSAVRSSGRDTLAEGLLISRDDPEVSFSVEELRIRDLHTWNDGFDATGIWAEGVAVATKNLEVAIPSAKVESLTMPGLQGLVFDPRHVMTFIAQAYAATTEARFLSVSAPEIKATSRQTSAQTGDTFSADITYRNLSIAGMSEGIFGRISAGPIDMHMISPDGTFDVGVQSASSDRIDLGALAHVFDPDEYVDGQDGGSWRSVLSNIVYSGISGSGPGGLNFGLDEMALEDLKGRQLEEPFTQTWDQLLDMTTDQDSKTELALELIHSYAAWRLGAFRLAGFSVEAPEEKAKLALDALTMSGISSDGIDSLGLTGLDGSAEEGFVKLGSAEMTDFVTPDLEALLGLAALEKNADPAEHAEGIKKSFAAMPRVAHLSLVDAAAGKSEDDAIALASLDLDMRDWNDLFAETTDIRVTGLTVPPHLLGPSTADLIRRLGYDDLVVGLSISDRWSPETGADNAVWTITLQEGGEVQFTYGLTGLTSDWLVKATAAAAATEDSEEAVMAMLAELKLKTATLSITDRSLLERAFGFAAEVQELDVDGPTYLKQMRAAFPFLISAALPPALSRLIAKPVQGFLAGGQTLVAEIAPAAPVNMEEFRAAADDPLSLPDFLDLKLRSEAPAE